MLIYFYISILFVTYMEKMNQLYYNEYNVGIIYNLRIFVKRFALPSYKGNPLQIA